MSEKQSRPTVTMETAEGSKPCTSEVKQSITTTTTTDQQSPHQQKRQPQQPQKSPSLLPRSRTSSAPIGSNNPNVTSHPLHATNLSLSTSTSSKSSPKSSFRTHFQPASGAATTTTPSSPNSALRSATSVSGASVAATSAAPVPPLVGSVPKTPPRRRTTLNTHRGVLDMRLHIPVQDMSSCSDRHAPFSPNPLGEYLITQSDVPQTEMTCGFKTQLAR